MGKQNQHHQRQKHPTRKTPLTSQQQSNNPKHLVTCHIREKDQQQTI